MSENVPEYLRRRFRGNVPDYIVKFFDRRARLRQERERKIEEAAAAKERERERIRALRRPPTNVRLDGRKIRWEPPETADQLPPAGYWVSEERNGSWTKHGDYVLPERRSAVLFGSGPAYVETWYHQMALGEMYRSPIVHQAAAATSPPPAADGDKNAALIATLRRYLSEKKGRPPAYYDRWTRALAALGGVEHANPMTANEAQAYADRGWTRWIPVAAAIRRVENARL